jgi:hypothetical protein
VGGKAAAGGTNQPMTDPSASWTDGSARPERGLKHRAAHETRTIPIPPELVRLLRAHIKRYRTTPDGGSSTPLNSGATPAVDEGRNVTDR